MKKLLTTSDLTAATMIVRLWQVGRITSVERNRQLGVYLSSIEVHALVGLLSTKTTAQAIVRLILDATLQRAVRMTARDTDRAANVVPEEDTSRE